jgi:dCMP deaminase
MTNKREVPGWDEYFMGLANFAKLKSKDRSTQVGAVIVSKDNAILSIGYNGFPRGVNDDIEERHERPLKYQVTEHAERNSIYSAARNGVCLKDATIYITGGGFACADCARGIIQAGISMAIGNEGNFEGVGPWAESCRVGQEMMDEAGLVLVLLDKDFKRRIVSLKRE